jgi:hypothetical protein
MSRKFHFPGLVADYPMATTAIAVDGSATVLLCADYCSLTWDNAGRYSFLSDFERQFNGSYRIPVAHDTGLPSLPAGGFTRVKEVTNSKMNTLIPWHVESAISTTAYAYTREDSRRNLYRIQLP